MIDNTQPENDRFWMDAFGLALFSVGAILSSLLALALTDGPGEAGAATGTAAMGHGLLWIGGAIPVGLIGISCLLMGAAQFLGWVENQLVTRHLAGVLAVSMSLSLVLGAFSDSAGGLVGMSTGGALADLSSPTLAGFVGLVALCLSVWGAWLSPAKTTAWEQAQEIEKPAMPLQASADGVTTEESAALSFEGASTAYPGAAVSPYPEDVRSRGEIPEGASVLGAEESSEHDENRDEQEAGTSGDSAAPEGDEAAVEAAQEDNAFHLEANGDGDSLDGDLVATELSSEAEGVTASEPQDGLSHGGWESSDSAEVEQEDELEEEGEPEELEESAELEEEDSEEATEEEEEEDSEWEEEDSEEAAEEEEDSEWEEEESEEAAELEEEEGDAEEEEEEEEELEEAAELEEEDEPSEEQGDLFGVEGAVDEPEVVLEPQAASEEAELEVEEGAEADQTILMKAADLFLERDRVAVSLLQRQFNVDFEECCVILDQLQEMGLIGPYLGGNRRDILLTRDQWLDHVSETT